jgi:hypothetical protein
MRVSDLDIEVVFIADNANPKRAHLTPDPFGRDLIPISANGRHRWTDIADLRVCLNCLGVRQTEPLVPCAPPSVT